MSKATNKKSVIERKGVVQKSLEILGAKFCKEIDQGVSLGSR